MEFHRIAAIFPLLKDDDLQLLADSIKADGLQHQIVTFENKILDGRNRYRACQLAGVDPTFKPWMGTATEAIDFVWRENRLRRQLTSEQIAACTVLRERMDAEYRAAVEAEQQAAKERQREGGKIAGRGRPKKKAEPEKVPKKILEPKRQDRESAAVQARAAGTNPTYLRKARKMDDDELRAVADGEARLEPRAHVANNSGENEWYTPGNILDAARKVLGSIDLDPASSAVANLRVKATRFYSADDDGLAKPWAGKVWMNPPYAKKTIPLFAKKLLDSLGSIEAITLTNNSTDTKWFQLLAEHSSAICLISGRVKFLSPEGEKGAPLQGQAVLYFGPDADCFIREFAIIGVCYVRKLQS